MKLGLPTNLFFSKINLISYGKFGKQKVHTFWFMVYNLKHNQIGDNLKNFEKNLQELQRFFFFFFFSLSLSMYVWTRPLSGQKFVVSQQNYHLYLCWAKLWNFLPNLYCLRNKAVARITAILRMIFNLEIKENLT